jgi:hypothetical protein
MSFVVRALSRLRFSLPPIYSFGVMKLFEPPKSRAELSPVFVLPSRHPGHSAHKHRTQKG